MARWFAGSGARLTGAPPVTAAPFSVSLWIWLDALPATQTPFCMGVSGSADNRWSILVSSGGTVLWRARTTANTDASVAAGMTAGVWFHVCAVEASATSHTVYVNTTPDTDTQSRIPAGANSLTIGAGVNAGDGPLTGSVADFALWRAALTAHEVALLWRKAPPFLIQPVSLVRYSPFGSEPDVDLMRGGLYTPTGTLAYKDHPRGLWTPGSFANLYGSTHVPLGVPLAKRRPRDRDILNAAAAAEENVPPRRFSPLYRM